MNTRSLTGTLVRDSLRAEIDGFDSLAELALDMRWSWNHATDEVWRQLDPDLWEITQNPCVVLQTVSRDKVERVLADPVFLKDVDGLVQTRRQWVEAPAWFQQNQSQGVLTVAAYFSMEFMLSEALPIYSGGPGGYVFSAAVSAARPSADHTARVIPHCDGVTIPLEDARILWER